MKLSYEVNALENEVLSAQYKFYMTNDFLCITDKSKDKLETIAKDYELVSQLVNIYPGHGYVSKLASNDYKILCICDKNNSNIIIQFLHDKHGVELDNISEIINPTVNGRYMCEVFKANYVP